MDVVDRLINRNMLAICRGKKPDDALDEAADEIIRLRAEVEALRPDAERYRWLRDFHWSDGNHRELCMMIQLQRNAEWDDTIDAALRGEGE